MEDVFMITLNNLYCEQGLAKIIHINETRATKHDIIQSCNICSNILWHDGRKQQYSNKNGQSLLDNGTVNNFLRATKKSWCYIFYAVQAYNPNILVHIMFTDACVFNLYYYHRMSQHSLWPNNPYQHILYNPQNRYLYQEWAVM